jgi:CHAT domain-containing protein
MAGGSAAPFSRAGAKKKARQAAVARVSDKDPEVLLRSIDKGELVEPEDYLNVALIEWLPHRCDNPRSEKALRTLADRFAAQHRDTWLRDVLATKCSDGTTRGLGALSAAIQANLADETEEALEKSSEAANRLREAGNRLAALRADAEHVYALRWKRASAVECVREADGVVHQAEAGRYFWILGQALIDRGNCRSRVGDSVAARADFTRALDSLHDVGYRDLELRAAGILADAQTGAGNFAASWNGARARLEQYWKGAHPAIRAQQIYFGLARSARSLGLLQAAYQFECAAANSIAETFHRRFEATAWTDLARSATAAGRPREAKAAFERAEQIFNSLKPTDSNQTSHALAKLDRAQAQIDSGDTQAVLVSLEEIRPWALTLADANQIEYHGLLAEALWLGGLTTRAEEAYLHAIGLSERSLGTFRQPRDRVQLLTAASRAYRGIVEILWSRDDRKGALQHWEWFRAGETPQHRADLNLKQRIKRLGRESFLSYVMMRDSVVAWLFDDRGITGQQLPVRRNDLETVASRFLRECSDPASDQRALERDSEQLYVWLVAPFAEHLDQTRTLVIEPDGPVAVVPMQALMDERRRYLGERFAIAIASGLADYQRRAEIGLVDTDTRALIIADPSLRGDTAKIFPHLPGSMREAEAVAGRFRRRVVLSGAIATVPALEEHLPNTELLHFAGHGFSNGGNGGLLLSPAEHRSEEAGVLEGSAMAKQDWHHCRLAVLSACSAGTGETRGPVNPQSLVRGLLWAGVARVVASRWNVEDDGGTFMERFYSDLLSGNDAATALRNASEEVRQSKGTSHPYYWAGFQTFGTR